MNELQKGFSLPVDKLQAIYTQLYVIGTVWRQVDTQQTGTVISGISNRMKDSCNLPLQVYYMLVKYTCRPYHWIHTNVAALVLHLASISVLPIDMHEYHGKTVVPISNLNFRSLEAFEGYVSPPDDCVPKSISIIMYGDESYATFVKDFLESNSADQATSDTIAAVTASYPQLLTQLKFENEHCVPLLSAVTHCRHSVGKTRDGFCSHYTFFNDTGFIKHSNALPFDRLLVENLIKKSTIQKLLDPDYHLSFTIAGKRIYFSPRVRINAVRYGVGVKFIPTKSILHEPIEQSWSVHPGTFIAEEAAANRNIVKYDRIAPLLERFFAKTGFWENFMGGKLGVVNTSYARELVIQQAPIALLCSAPGNDLAYACERSNITTVCLANQLDGDFVKSVARNHSLNIIPDFNLTCKECIQLIDEDIVYADLGLEEPSDSKLLSTLYASLINLIEAGKTFVIKWQYGKVHLTERVGGTGPILDLCAKHHFTIFTIDDVVSNEVFITSRVTEIMPSAPGELALPLDMFQTMFAKEKRPWYKWAVSTGDIDPEPAEEAFSPADSVSSSETSSGSITPTGLVTAAYTPPTPIASGWQSLGSSYYAPNAPSLPSTCGSSPQESAALQPYVEQTLNQVALRLEALVPKPQVTGSLMHFDTPDGHSTTALCKRIIAAKSNLQPLKVSTTTNTLLARIVGAKASLKPVCRRGNPKKQWAKRYLSTVEEEVPPPPQPPSSWKVVTPPKPPSIDGLIAHRRQRYSCRPKSDVMPGPISTVAPVIKNLSNVPRRIVVAALRGTGTTLSERFTRTTSEKPIKVTLPVKQVHSVAVVPKKDTAASGPFKSASGEKPAKVLKPNPSLQPTGKQPILRQNVTTHKNTERTWVDRLLRGASYIDEAMYLSFFSKFLQVKPDPDSILDAGFSFVVIKDSNILGSRGNYTVLITKEGLVVPVLKSIKRQGIVLKSKIDFYRECNKARTQDVCLCRSNDAVAVAIIATTAAAHGFVCTLSDADPICGACKDQSKVTKQPEAPVLRNAQFQVTTDDIAKLRKAATSDLAKLRFPGVGELADKVRNRFSKEVVPAFTHPVKYIHGVAGCAKTSAIVASIDLSKCCVTSPFKLNLPEFAKGTSMPRKSWTFHAAYANYDGTIPLIIDEIACYHPYVAVSLIYRASEHGSPVYLLGDPKQGKQVDKSGVYSGASACDYYNHKHYYGESYSMLPEVCHWLNRLGHNFKTSSTKYSALHIHKPAAIVDADREYHCVTTQMAIAKKGRLSRWNTCTSAQGMRAKSMHILLEEQGLPLLAANNHALLYMILSRATDEVHVYMTQNMERMLKYSGFGAHSCAGTRFAGAKHIGSSLGEPLIFTHVETTDLEPRETVTIVGPHNNNVDLGEAMHNLQGFRRRQSTQTSWSNQAKRKSVAKPTKQGGKSNVGLSWRQG